MDRRFLIILVAIFVGFFGFIWFQKSQNKTNTSSSETSQGSSNYYGKMDSPVTITEFVDFQCEACYAYYPYVKQIKEMYKDQVKFQVRYFPIVSSHKLAMQAAKSAQAAALQGKFWEMHNKLFEGQKTWEQTTDPQSYFDQYAQAIGLNMEKFKVDRTSNEVNSVVNKDLQDVQALGGSGTPTFVINGKKVENPGASAEALSKMIDNALKEAGITPSPSPAQPTTSSQSLSPAGSGGLNPGETQAEHDKEKQGQ